MIKNMSMLIFAVALLSQNNLISCGRDANNSELVAYIQRMQEVFQATRFQLNEHRNTAVAQDRLIQMCHDNTAELLQYHYLRYKAFGVQNENFEHRYEDCKTRMNELKKDNDSMTTIFTATIGEKIAAYDQIFPNSTPTTFEDCDTVEKEIKKLNHVIDQYCEIRSAFEPATQAIRDDMEENFQKFELEHDSNTSFKISFQNMLDFIEEQEEINEEDNVTKILEQIQATYGNNALAIVDKVKEEREKLQNNLDRLMGIKILLSVCSEMPEMDDLTRENLEVLNHTILPNVGANIQRLDSIHTAVKGILAIANQEPNQDIAN